MPAAVLIRQPWLGAPRAAPPQQHAHRALQSRAPPPPRSPACLQRRGVVRCQAGAAAQPGEALAKWLAQFGHDDCGVAIVPEKDGSG